MATESCLANRIRIRWGPRNRFGECTRPAAERQKTEQSYPPQSRRSQSKLAVRTISQRVGNTRLKDKQVRPVSRYRQSTPHRPCRQFRVHGPRTWTNGIFIVLRLMARRDLGKDCRFWGVISRNALASRSLGCSQPRAKTLRLIWPLLIGLKPLNSSSQAKRDPIGPSDNLR